METKDNPVTYEHWYNAQTLMKERINDIKNQINDIQAEQPNLIKGAVKEIVNGKIDKMNQLLQDYMKESKEWRDSADEKLDLVGDIQGFSKISLKLLGYIITVGGATAVIIKWLHK